ncbi:MAG: hypothetical protein ACW981_19885 [Candidatus Hodarchaeales archaeon]
MNLEEFFWTVLTILFFSILGIIFFPFIITSIILMAIYYGILMLSFKMHDLAHYLHFCPACGVFPSFLKKKVTSN